MSTARAVARRGTSSAPHHGGAACASYGHVPHEKTGAAILFECGWLPRHAAADAMNISLADLDRAVEAGAIRKRRIGPGALLYQVVI